MAGSGGVPGQALQLRRAWRRHGQRVAAHPFASDWEARDERDGVFEENMVVAVESCIGREDGGECVKLEDMVVVRNDRCQLLSTFPFEADLLA